jgi:hypothetical protein
MAAMTGYGRDAGGVYQNPQKFLQGLWRKRMLLLCTNCTDVVLRVK